MDISYYDEGYGWQKGLQNKGVIMGVQEVMEITLRDPQ